MKIELKKSLNLFIPEAPVSFEGFKESFSIDVVNAIIVPVDSDKVRERILLKRPDLSETISGFMPSNAELEEMGTEMADITVDGTDSEGKEVKRVISLNRLVSMDKNNTWNDVHKKVQNKPILNISNITYDATSRTVIFS